MPLKKKGHEIKIITVEREILFNVVAPDAVLIICLTVKNKMIPPKKRTNLIIDFCEALIPISFKNSKIEISSHIHRGWYPLVVVNPSKDIRPKLT
jgi:hypothetical protein